MWTLTSTSAMPCFKENILASPNKDTFLWNFVPNSGLRTCHHGNKLVINLKKISYTNRLQRLKLPTLKYRRLRGDMIEVFKMTLNFLIAHFATIYENIISLHVSLTFGTVCQTVLWMSAL